MKKLSLPPLNGLLDILRIELSPTPAQIKVDQVEGCF